MLAKGSSTGALRPGDVVSARYRVERFLERSAQEESYAVRALEDGHRSRQDHGQLMATTPIITALRSRSRFGYPPAHVAVLRARQ